MDKLKIVEWFGGIGAATTAIKRLGMDYQIVDYVELDKHAIKSFNLLNGTSFEPKDINDVNVNGYGEVDMLVAGWPCQDLSIAGKQAGLIDGERSSLIWTTIRKISEMTEKPKVILLENVKGLLSEKHKEGFAFIRESFENMGYYFSYKLLNSKFFGVPQNRERVYCVLKRDKPFNWEWANKFNKIEVKPIDILDNEAKWEIAKNFVKKSKYGYINATEKDLKLNSSFKRYWNVKDDYIGTATASVPPKIYYEKENGEVLYRKLTSSECWKLMGFTNEEFNKVKDRISNSQLCKQAGNSIVVNVLVEIFKELYKNSV